MPVRRDEGQRVTPEPVEVSLFNGEVHPYAADYFRMLPDDELDELARDIAENGLKEALLLDQDGRLIDGRNRLEACRRAGVRPIFDMVNLTEVEAVAKIRSGNNRRRHDSPGARAMQDAVGLQREGKRRNGRWKRGSVRNPESGITPTKTEQNALDKAGFVLDWCPNLAPQVANDHLALDAAYQQAKAAEDEAKAEERAAELAASLLADLRDNRPDLADLVDKEALPLEDALIIRDKERAEEAKRLNSIAERRRKFSADLSGAVHYLAPLSRYAERREQITTDYDPGSMLLPITRADTQAARDALDLIDQLQLGASR